MVIHFNCQWKTRFYQANLDGFVVVAQFRGFFMYFILLENYNSNNIGLFTSTKEDFTWKTFFNWIIFANNSPNIFNFNWNWVSQWFFLIRFNKCKYSGIDFCRELQYCCSSTSVEYKLLLEYAFQYVNKLCLLRSNI